MVEKNHRNPSASGGARPASHAAAPAPRRRAAQGGRPVSYGKVGRSKYSSRPGPARPTRRSSGSSYAAAFIVIAALALIAVGGLVWWTQFRPVQIKVNGSAVNVRINSSIEDLLEGNDYFGAKPGRLLSVSDNVLDEQGGSRATVTVNGEGIDGATLAQRTVSEGDEITVENGSDAYEEHDVQAEEIQPSVKMETGGAIQFVSQWGKPGKREVWIGKQSGETADKGVTVEPVEMVISSYNAKPKDDGKKYIALTFDDGPGKDTGKILDILKEKGVHATFYNLGLNAETYPDLCRRVVDEGHELASHTNQHMNLPKQSTDTLRNEITSAADRLEKAGGVRPQMIRAPYGAFTQADWQRSGDLISCNVLWNIDTLDWKRPGAEALTQTVVKQAHNGAIVLMHDGGGDRSQNVEALPGIIDGLKEKGYTFVTVSELMKLDGRFPDAVVKGTVSVPEGCVIPPVA